MNDMDEAIVNRLFTELDVRHRYNKIVVERILPILAQLRHAYKQLDAETVVDQEQFANSLLSPQICALEDLICTVQSAINEDLEQVTRLKNGPLRTGQSH